MKTFKKRIKIIVEKTNTGFSAYAIDYGIAIVGDTIQELKENALEAANLYFEDDQIEVTEDNILLEIDFKQFFQYYKVLNAKFLAAKIGMNPTLLSQYVRGIKKPTIKQRDRILLGINQIGRELAHISLTSN